MIEGKEQKNPFSLKNEAFDWMEAIVFAIVTVVLIFTFLFRIVIVSGSSMLPNLVDGDRLILNSAFYTPKAGDIVVILKDEGAFSDEPIIKRIIATEGQTIDIDYDHGYVIIDGVAKKENYINPMTNDPTKDSANSQKLTFPAKVPKGYVFVMGDNRDHSTDSRIIGMIKLSEIKGHAVMRLFPLNKFGLLKNKNEESSNVQTVQVTTAKTDSETTTEQTTKADDPINSKTSITINNQSYNVILEDNETVKELSKTLPLEQEFIELNGNEKYCNLKNTLPTNEENVGTINKGDIMLYGDNCLVIFYKSFNTTYNYTKIGHIENMPDLSNENLIIKIENTGLLKVDN